jgi:hypothetical protein
VNLVLGIWLFLSPLAVGTIPVALRSALIQLLEKAGRSDP